MLVSLRTVCLVGPETKDPCHSEVESQGAVLAGRSVVMCDCGMCRCDHVHPGQLSN